MHERVAFISGQYSAPAKWRRVPLIRCFFTLRNILKARHVAIQYWRLGYSVVCPHMNTAFFDGHISYDEALEGCFTQIRRLNPETDMVVMLPEWFYSAGAVREWALATVLGIPVRYWSDADQFASPNPY